MWHWLPWKIRLYRDNPPNPDHHSSEVATWSRFYIRGYVRKQNPIRQSQKNSCVDNKNSIFGTTQTLSPGLPKIQIKIQDRIISYIILLPIILFPNHYKTTIPIVLPMDSYYTPTTDIHIQPDKLKKMKNSMHYLAIVYIIRKSMINCYHQKPSLQLPGFLFRNRHWTATLHWRSASVLPPGPTCHRRKTLARRSGSARSKWTLQTCLYRISISRPCWKAPAKVQSNM